MILYSNLKKQMRKQSNKINRYVMNYIGEDLWGDLWEEHHNLINSKKPKIISQVIFSLRYIQMIWAKYKISRQDNISPHINENKNKKKIDKNVNKFRLCIVLLCFYVFPKLSDDSHISKNESQILKIESINQPKLIPYLVQKEINKKQMKAEEKQMKAEEQQMKAEEQQMKAEEQQMKAEEQQMKAEAQYWLQVAQDYRKQAQHCLQVAQKYREQAQHCLQVAQRVNRGC